MRHVNRGGLILLMIFIGCVNQSVIEPGKELQLIGFTHGDCDSAVNPYDKSELGVREVTCVSSTTLQVQVYVSATFSTFLTDNFDLSLNYHIQPHSLVWFVCSQCTWSGIHHLLMNA